MTSCDHRRPTLTGQAHVPGMEADAAGRPRRRSPHPGDARARELRHVCRLSQALREDDPLDIVWGIAAIGDSNSPTEVGA